VRKLLARYKRHSYPIEIEEEKTEKARTHNASKRKLYSAKKHPTNPF